MADKIAVLRLGELEQFGRPLDLYNRPRNIFVAGFIGSPKMNFLKGTVAGDGATVDLDTGEALTLPGTGFTHAAGQAVTVGIRPNHLSIDEGGALHVEVASVEQLGGEAYVYGRLKNGDAMTLHMPGQIGAQIGEVLRMTPEQGELHLFDSASGLSLRAEA